MTKVSKIFWISYKNYLIFKDNTVNELILVWLESALYFFSIGYGIGQFVPSMEGVSYLEYLFPGMTGVVIMLLSFLDAFSSNYKKFRSSIVTKSMLMKPISRNELILGEIVWSAFRGFLGGLGLLIIGWLIGIMSFKGFVLIFPVLIILSLIFSSLGFISIFQIKNWNHFRYIKVIFLFPLVLISGAFFPIKSNPINTLIQVSPLYQAIVLIRNISLEQFSNMLWLHFFVLVFAVWICLKISVKQMTGNE